MKPTFFGNTETSKDYNLVGIPSDELDASWSSIMQYFYAEVPKEYIQSLDRERDSIRLPNGNYLANYSFIHQLYCLPDMTEEEKELQLEHSLTMCKADETPFTMIWFDESILPGGGPSPMSARAGTA
ncbi:Uu.00g087510.m01.CDS01 [Anthostomella pinea]|uniref:Uu.00g087510.m01.CDS01 n=1 Tax=Anthostomella pinea TaxID=933095 RepID=A0AAI8VMC6_9PEZI|nr:Uu.00g087510.m01.CDS01 [Anthostomella pinea]